MKKRVIAGLLGLSLLVLAAKVVEDAPPITLRSVEGRTYSLAKLKGRLVFLTFFKEGCVPCKKEIPFLSDLAARYPSALVVLGIGFQEKDPARLQAVAASFGARFPVLVDKEGLVARGYRVTAVPFGVLVDENGKIAGKWFGFQEAELQAQIEPRVQRLIAQQTTRAIAVAVFTEATDGAKKAGLGANLQQIVSEGLRSRGIAVAPPGGVSAYTVEGSVSKIGPVNGVSITVSQTSSKLKMEEFNQSVMREDYKPLLDDLAQKIIALP